MFERDVEPNTKKHLLTLHQYNLHQRDLWLSGYGICTTNVYKLDPGRDNLTVRESVHHAVYGKNATSLCRKLENKLKHWGFIDV